MINTSNTLNLLPFIQLFESKNIPWQEHAAQHDIPSTAIDTPSWVPSYKVFAFLSSMSALTGLNIGAHAGTLSSIDQLFPQLLDKVSTFEEAIAKLINAMTQISSHVTVWTQKIDGVWFLCYRSAYSSDSIGFEQTEWFRCFAFIEFCKRFLGQQWQPNKIHVQLDHIHPDLPKGYTKQQIVLNEQFGAIEIELTKDFEVLNNTQQSSDWFSTVIKLVDSYAHLPWFNIDWFCQLIGVSTRTMQRQLHKNNTSFLTLRNNARYRRACHSLRNSTLSIEEIAYLCGYNDVSNFNRAFKRWSGQTAPEYRRYRPKP
ncbi:helix-turn-helix domain-containing protein [Vibrio agarivorans]|uniref:helix-turn-helix domain-containing protein n=1 Tax=Vibrio agarivorans TaxID=153622 RepID=UPI0025B40A6C|nr:AraC family transcriptional regulator [Vibrio agarivorans]MDN3659736.1 AraC family transcriptional regulator [Vibrio agarivorans]